MGSRTMHHGAAIFANKRVDLSAQYRMLAKVWCQSANVTF